MELTEISRIVSELDDGVSKENAQVSIGLCGHDGDESLMVATQNGYLRLGVEFLKGGIVPYSEVEKQSHAIDVHLDYLMSETSDILFNSFERNEVLEDKTYEESWLDRAVITTIIVVLISIPIFAIVGLVTVIRALF